MALSLSRNLTLALIVAAGAALDTQAQRTMPEVAGGGYKIKAGPVELLVAPSRGARIRSLKHETTELLYQADSTGSPGSMGSTFWVSPQAHWTATCRGANNNGCWPPPTAHDGSGTASLYTGGLLTDSSVTYTGTANAYTGARLRKTIWGKSSDSSINIRYHIINTLTTKIAFAPWEVTRMTTGGLTFWAKSFDDTIRGNGTSGAALIAMITDTLGVKWHKYDSTVSLSGGTPKFWDATSEGWFAHVDKSRLLYIKKFVAIPKSKKAPVNENQIEYYTNNNTRSLIEMELQGAFDSIAPGDSMQWDVSWYVRRLPDSIPVTRNAALLALTRATVNGTPSSLNPGRHAGTVGAVRLKLSADHVSFALSEAASVTVEMMNTKGRVTERLHSGALESGSHSFKFAPNAGSVQWIVLRDAQARVLDARMVSPL